MKSQIYNLFPQSLFQKSDKIDNLLDKLKKKKILSSNTKCEKYYLSNSSQETVFKEKE